MLRPLFCLAVIAAAVALSLGAGPALANGFQSLDAIDREVARFTGAAIGQPGGASLPVDRQLRLRACSGPLALGWYGRNRQAVQVDCPDAGGWRIFVSVQAAPMAQPAAAARPIIQRRMQVRVEAVGSGFVIARQGMALDEGAAGEWIRVQMEEPGARGRTQQRVVTGQVQPDGRVTISIR